MEPTVIGLNTRRFFFSNWCYIIEDTQCSSAVIIDASWDIKMFSDEFMNRNLVPKAVFLTHSHFDHVNIIDKLVKRYNVQVYMHKDEIDFYHFRSRNLNALDNDAVVSVDHLSVNCFGTPGHTKGSACFQIGDNLFVGDTVFYEGCGRCDLSGGSALDMYYSIQLIKKHFSLDTKLFPGHVYRKPVGLPLKEFMRNNIYFNINGVNAFVNYRMRPSQKKWVLFR